MRRSTTAATTFLLVALAAACAPVTPVTVIDGPPVEPGDPCNGVVPQLCPV